MVWNPSVSYHELELVTWVLREVIVSVFAPLERLLVCILVKDRWASLGEAGMMIVQWIGFAGQETIVSSL